MKRILIASTQYPYYGGAATNSYALIKHFRSAGYLVAGVFFDNHREPVDPDKIGGVWRVRDKNSERLIKRMIITYLGGRPDVILGKNYGAPVSGRNLFPDAKIVYLVTGCPQMREMSEKKISAQRYLHDKQIQKFEPEALCIKSSDFVIPNSPLGKELLIKHYGNLSAISDPVNTSIAKNRSSKSKNFKDRKYGIAFVCSNLNRKVKNSNLAFNIFKKFPNVPKVVIGNNNKNFKKIPNTDVFNILPHFKVMNIMGNSKLVLCTSFYDASPNVITEALYSGCNILISKNCGWSELYPEEFVCQDVYTPKEWIEKVSFLLKNNIEYENSYNDDIILKIKEIVK